MTSKLLFHSHSICTVYDIGGGGKAPKPQPFVPPPTEAAPEVALAAASERERLKRAKGRAASQVTTPSQLAKQDTKVLKVTLG